MQAQPQPAALHEQILPLHGKRRAHPRKAVDHQADEGTVAQARLGRDVDRVEQGTRFLCLQHGGASGARAMGGAAHAGLKGTICPMTSQSNRLRIAANASHLAEDLGLTACSAVSAASRLPTSIRLQRLASRTMLT